MLINTDESGSTMVPHDLREILGMITKLRQQNQELRGAVLAQGSRSTRFKYPDPTPFDGTAGTLRGFLTQAKAYLAFYAANLPADADKVLCTAAFLRGNALAWFEPMQRDYVDHLDKPDDRDAEPTKVFSSYAYYESKIKGVFGDPDKERTTE